MRRKNMNYYIDFDNTLYNTPVLCERMLRVMAKEISNNTNGDEETLYTECKAMFNRENIYDIYKLVQYFEEKYNIEKGKIAPKVTETILNGSDLVFDDVVPFLTKLKENGHKLYMLTYCTDSLEFQTKKIAGSKIGDYFDSIYMTKERKYTLDINYENGIFIDDNPKDLLGLYSKNPKEVIRLRRAGNKYSIEDIENSEIKEYVTLTNFYKSLDKCGKI
jgi:phosphoglycolate phosphatase-like HAD superfamily hydrolase